MLLTSARLSRAGEAAAQGDNAKGRRTSSASAKNICGTWPRPCPARDRSRMAADMEGDPVGIEPPLLGLRSRALATPRTAETLTGGIRRRSNRPASEAQNTRAPSPPAKLRSSPRCRRQNRRKAPAGRTRRVLLLLDGVADGAQELRSHGDAGRCTSSIRRGSRCRTSSRRGQGASDPAPPDWPSRRRRVGGRQ